MVIPQRLKDRNTIQPSNPITEYINHSVIKTHAHIMLIVILFTIAKTWNQHKYPSMIDWIKKMWYIYTTEYYAAIERNEIMSFVGTWTDLEAIILSKLT